MSNQSTATADLVGGMDAHAREVAQGERFQFGKNWAAFLSVLDDERIGVAERALQELLETPRLDGLRFLDIGSGSGLSSLAARRLGATVHSLDYDPQSVACTEELRRRYFSGDPKWVVERGSALDADHLRSLGPFDIVYSWGVLHHTGSMWTALENAAIPVAPGGRLFVSIYNDTGTQSRRWAWIKRTYNELPRFLRTPFAIVVTIPGDLRIFTGAALRGKPGDYIRLWTDYRRRRGMSRWYDIIDWVGGYPYEYATSDQVFDFYRRRGFTLANMKCGAVGRGCNEFVFARSGRPVATSSRTPSEPRRCEAHPR